MYFDNYHGINVVSTIKYQSKLKLLKATLDYLNYKDYILFDVFYMEIKGLMLQILVYIFSLRTLTT